MSYLDANDGLPGVVYILTNEALREDVFKIGQSTRSGNARATELNNEGKTGMPKRYRCIFEVSTGDCGRAEKAVHRRLHSGRMTKEFFRVDLEHAKAVILEECSRFANIDEDGVIIPARVYDHTSPAKFPRIEPKPSKHAGWGEASWYAMILAGVSAPFLRDVRYSAAIFAGVWLVAMWRMKRA